MIETIAEYEGSWEELERHRREFAGHRLKLQVFAAPLDRPAPGDSRTRTIAEELAEIAAQAPDEELAKLPPDLTDQLDHYIYGTPKR